MSDFQKYMEAQARRESAFNAYNAASLKLELEQIRCRQAEAASQHEPLASMIPFSVGSPEYVALRKQLLDAMFWVVVGRRP